MIWLLYNAARRCLSFSVSSEHFLSTISQLAGLYQVVLIIFPGVADAHFFLQVLPNLNGDYVYR
jgi:hypothetical protein